jgi:hypothetical protein
VQPIDLFARIYDLPPSIGTRMLSLGIPRVIPIARGLGISVDNVDDHGASSSMPLSRRARNHVGSIYIGALIIHAEVTMATWAIRRCRPPAFRVLVKSNTAEFHARATGAVRATVTPTDDEKRAWDACASLPVGEKGEATLSVVTKSVHDGRDVCTVRFILSVKRAG